jgi:hypothetical protein
VLFSETFNATLECELLVQHRFKSYHEASLAIFEFIEGWYNPAPPAFGPGLPFIDDYERRMNGPPDAQSEPLHGSGSTPTYHLELQRR